MTRHILSILVVASLALSACSSAEGTTPNAQPTRGPTTTTTEPPTTTTTTMASIRIADAPAGLSRLIEGFYAYADGEIQVEPAAPEKVLSSIEPGDVSLPSSGSAAVATFEGSDIAVVEVGADLFLAVDGDSGWRIVGGSWPSLSIPEFFGNGPRLVAVVGSDARPGENVERTRADSIHFVGLDGSGGGAVVGVPRDSYVPVAGIGRRKINSSLSLGGPETMMATFEDLTDLDFEGYVLTGFAGFEDLADTVLGGIEVDVPIAINDRWAHVALSAGRQVLDGMEALGFARARKTIQGGDFTRSQHQGMLLLAAADTVRALGYQAIPGLLEASEQYLFTDLTPAQLLTFSAMAISADPDRIDNLVASGSPGTAGGASVVYLSSSTSDLWADLANGRLDD